MRLRSKARTYQSHLKQCPPGGIADTADIHRRARVRLRIAVDRRAVERLATIVVERHVPTPERCFKGARRRAFAPRRAFGR